MYRSQPNSTCFSDSSSPHTPGVSAYLHYIPLLLLTDKHLFLTGKIFFSLNFHYCTYTIVNIFLDSYVYPLLRCILLYFVIVATRIHPISPQTRHYQRISSMFFSYSYQFLVYPLHSHSHFPTISD